MLEPNPITLHLSIAEYACLYRDIVFDVRYDKPRDHHYAIEQALTDQPLYYRGCRQAVRQYLNNNKERLRLP